MLTPLVQQERFERLHGTGRDQRGRSPSSRRQRLRVLVDSAADAAPRPARKAHAGNTASRGHRECRRTKSGDQGRGYRRSRRTTTTCRSLVAQAATGRFHRLRTCRLIVLSRGSAGHRLEFPPRCYRTARQHPVAAHEVLAQLGESMPPPPLPPTLAVVTGELNDRFSPSTSSHARRYHAESRWPRAERAFSGSLQQGDSFRPDRTGRAHVQAEAHGIIGRLQKKFGAQRIAVRARRDKRRDAVFRRILRKPAGSWRTMAPDTSM